MPKRHELTDQQWQIIANLFFGQKPGNRWADHRNMINGVPWRLRTGTP